jgi:tetratricopeptide (TPR) repeat protein
LPTTAAPAPAEAETRAFNEKFARARDLVLAKNRTAARALSDELLAERPDHCGALIQRSKLEFDDDHYRLAREYTLSAFRAGATNKRQYMRLLRRLRLFNLIPEFHRLATQLPAALANDVDVAILVANLYESINEPEAALAAAMRAASPTPGPANLESAIGLAQLNLGCFNEAERHLRACLELEPGHAAAWWHLSRLRKSDTGDCVDRLRGAISRSNDPRDTALMAFALHRELDGLEDHAAAAQALDLACSSMRKVVNYDAQADERLFAALKTLPADDAVHRDKRQDPPPFTPIFIVGMQRSGTTLLERLLAGHDDICAGGELHEFPAQLRFAADHHCGAEIDFRIVDASRRFDYAAIGDGYTEAVDRRRHGQRFVTDKLPSNFLNLGMILRALPHAKILHMSRDPVETCFSNLREPFSESICRYSYDQADLAKYYRQYFSLMQHWRQRFPGRIHDVTYTSLATDPAAELKRATAYLGIEFRPSMADVEAGNRIAGTASAFQVREKPSLPLRPEWQPYREYLTPMIWRLSDVGQRY